ncbi:MAG TPA: glycosyltransferase [Thiotrichales bacterium]|nr:glycosyltransferase [Thiotrichales bacterium]
MGNPDNPTAPPPRISLVGPVTPFRGGIAQHTTMLHRAFSKLADIQTVSFSRQYPSWLFPGASDKDPDFAGHSEENVDYVIDSMNPLSWRQAVRLISDFRPDVALIPWWTIFWAPCFGYIADRLQKQGIRVTFFCHNVVDHETAGWKTWLSRRVLLRGSSYVVHTRADKAKLEQLMADPNILVHPHPIYDQFPHARGTLPRRGRVELLFYGFIRPYKGLEVLLEAMRYVDDHVFLTIAGECWGDSEALSRRIQKWNLSDRVSFEPRYHSAQETAELFFRADLVVLPYLSATGSGIIPIAYHYDTPVLATNVGGLPDVVDDERTGYLVEPGNPLALAKVINNFDPSSAPRMAEHIRQKKQSMSWDAMARAILKFAPSVSDNP